MKWLIEDAITEDDNIVKMCINMDRINMITEIIKDNRYQHGTLIWLDNDSCFRLTIDFPIFLEKYINV